MLPLLIPSCQCYREINTDVSKNGIAILSNVSNLISHVIGVTANKIDANNAILVC